MADLFEATVAICQKPKETSNWLMAEAMRLLKEYDQDMVDMSFSPENLAKLIKLVDNGTINRTVAKTVFEELYVNNTNPQSVRDYHNGKENAIGFLVGQTMKVMKGKADPGLVNKILKEMLA